MNLPLRFYLFLFLPASLFDRGKDIGGGDQANQRAAFIRDGKMMNAMFMHHSGTLHQGPIRIAGNNGARHNVVDSQFCRVSD